MGPGALIGRLETAQLRIEDERVSEVQAYVSARGQALVLRALKGMLRGRSGRRAEIVLAEGQRIMVARGLSVHVMALHIPEHMPEVSPTRPSGQLDPPLNIELHQETVRVHRAGQPTAELAGMPARIVCEVARFEAPTPWLWVAHEIWGRALDKDTLRQRWDRNNRSLRKKLRGIGVREDLVRADWSGNVELVLGPDDQVVDRG